MREISDSLRPCEKLKVERGRKDSDKGKSLRPSRCEYEANGRKELWMSKCLRPRRKFKAERGRKDSGKVKSLRPSGCEYETNRRKEL